MQITEALTADLGYRNLCGRGGWERGRRCWVLRECEQVPSSPSLQQTRRASSLISFNSNFIEKRGSNVLKFHSLLIQMRKLRSRKWRWLTQGHTASQGWIPKRTSCFWIPRPASCYAEHQYFRCGTASHKGRKCDSKKDPKMSYPLWVAWGWALKVDMDLDNNPWNLWDWQHLPLQSYKIILSSDTRSEQGATESQVPWVLVLLRGLRTLGKHLTLRA